MKNHKIYLALIPAFVMLLSGCPYLSKQDLDLGKKFNDKNLTGRWDMVRYEKYNDTSTQVVKSHIYVTESPKGVYHGYLSAAAGGPPSDSGIIHSRKYKDMQFLSFEFKNIYTQNRPGFAYFCYQLNKDTLFLSEVNGQLRYVVDSSKAANFSSLAPYIGTKGFKGDQYIFVKKAEAKK